MILRIERNNQKTKIAYALLPDSAVDIAGSNAIFHVRDQHGNGPDVIGTVTGSTQSNGPAILIEILNDDMLFALSGHLDQNSSFYVPYWLTEQFEPLDQLWKSQTHRTPKNND